MDGAKGPCEAIAPGQGVDSDDELVNEGHAPVVVGSAQKADEPISAPKGASFPHPSMFGLTMGFAANRRVRKRAVLAPRNLWAKAMPRWGSTSSCKQTSARQTSALLPPKATDPGPRQLFPCKTAVSEGRGKGP
jgi:hypothetical protein